MKFLNIVRLIFLSLIIIINALILYTTISIKKDEKCMKCTKSWIIKSLEYVTYGLLALTGINVFIRFNKHFSGLFVVGTVFSVAVLCAMIYQLYLLFRLEDSLDDSDCKCDLNSAKNMSSALKIFGTVTYVIIVLVTGIIFLKA